MSVVKVKNMLQKTILVLLLIIFLIGQPAPVICEGPMIIGRFSSADSGNGLPENWEPLIFKGISSHTIYEKFNDDGVTVIKAISNASASGLIRKISIDPQKYPIIRWRWKVSNIYQHGDVTKKSGDDYPARIYIAFEYSAEKVGLWEKAKFAALKLLYGEYPPIGAINYIWESKAPKGTIIPNPYTDRVRMIVVESGGENLNVWRQEERNIYEDYINAFGQPPSMISGIAIMTDSDNTGESAVSFYGDIILEPIK
jgi:hypothetical protein